MNFIGATLCMRQEGHEDQENEALFKLPIDIRLDTGVLTWI